MRAPYTLRVLTTIRSELLSALQDNWEGRHVEDAPLRAMLWTCEQLIVTWNEKQPNPGDRIAGFEHR